MGLGMIWVCTDWQVNWPAIAAVSTALAMIVALGFGVANVISSYFRRRAKARVIELLVGPEMGRVSGCLHRIFEGWLSHLPENVSGFVDANIWLRQDMRSNLSFLLVDLEHPLLEQNLSRIHVLPDACVTAIVRYLDCLECFKRQTQLVAGHMENDSEFVRKGFAQCRSYLNDLIVLGWTVDKLCGADSVRPWYRWWLPTVHPPSALEIVKTAFAGKGQELAEYRD